MAWQILGFAKNKAFFDEALKNDSLENAYLFYGQDMIGKRSFALELAHKVLGIQQAHRNPDLHLLGAPQGASIMIEDIRKAKSALSISSYYGGRRVLIIDNAHLMTQEAQNALLKILEEPPQKAVIILVSDSPDALLNTIRSRCQEIAFSPHNREDFNKALQDSGLGQKQTDFLYKFTNGRIGLVKAMLEEDSFNEIKNIMSELAEFSNTPLYKRLDIARRMAELNREELQRRVLYWILYIHTKAESSNADDGTYMLLDNLFGLYKIIAHPQFNMRLALENFAVKI